MNQSTQLDDQKNILSELLSTLKYKSPALRMYICTCLYVYNYVVYVHTYVH